MKKSILSVLFSFATLAVSAQDTFEITSVRGGETLLIAGKEVKVGDKFSAEDTIVWDGKRHAMEVKQVSTGNVYRFSQRQFSAKGNDVKSLKGLRDYTTVEIARDENGKKKVNLTMKETNKGEYYAEKRFAVVMANSFYSGNRISQNGCSVLAEAQKKATQLTDSLNDLGYDVLECYDLNQGEEKTVLNSFSMYAKEYAAVLFYYCGNIVIKDGKAYLAPVNVTEENDIPEVSVECSAVLAKMAALPAASRTVVIDGVLADGTKADVAACLSAEATTGLTMAYSVGDEFLGSRSENLYTKTKEKEAADAAAMMDAINAMAAMEQASQPTTTEDFYNEGLRLSDKQSQDYDIDNAIAYLKKAANAGHKDAMYQLALIYQDRDAIQSMMWMGRASAAGHEKAKAYVTANKQQRNKNNDYNSIGVTVGK